MQVGKETIYNAEFQNSLKAVNQPDWLKNAAQKCVSVFHGKRFSAPQTEEWKYTNVAPMGKENFLLAELSETATDAIESGKFGN